MSPKRLQERDPFCASVCSRNSFFEKRASDLCKFLERSRNSFFEKRASDLCKFLEERGYKKKYVEEQIDRARRSSRDEVLAERPRKENTRVPFVVTYHPGLPHIGGLLQKLHPVLHSSTRCKEAIPQVPMVAYRKPKSLAQYLVRARFTNAPKENINGTLKCTSRNCQICNFLCLGDTFCSNKNGKEFKINYNLDCNCSNVIYLINCTKCKVQYVGSTTTRFRTRFNNHTSRVNAHVNLSLNQKGKDDLIYRHFNSDGHRGLEDMQIQLIDHVKGEKELRERENHWIYKLATLAPHGLNDNDGFYAQNKKSRAGARAR